MYAPVESVTVRWSACDVASVPVCAVTAAPSSGAPVEESVTIPVTVVAGIAMSPLVSPETVIVVR